MVCPEAAGQSHSVAHDNEVAETADDHRGEVYGSVTARIHERKISVTMRLYGKSTMQLPIFAATPTIISR